jgi:hypothetical protein
MASRPRKGRQGKEPRYLQALWDRISGKPGEVPVPESHLNLAEARLAEYRRDPGRARPALPLARSGTGPLTRRLRQK